MEVNVYDLETGQKTGTENLPGKASTADARLPASVARPEYPWNDVSVSRSGHERHVDDTPGQERLREGHAAGGYWEISADGRKVELVVANEYKYIKGGLTLTIDNNGDIKMGGSLRLVIAGDMHAEVNGDLTASVGGSMVAAIDKNLEAHVQKDAVITVGENMTSTVGKDLSVAVEGNMAAIVNGSSASTIKGESFETVEGNKSTVVKGAWEVKADSINIEAAQGVTQKAGTDVSIKADGNIVGSASGTLDLDSDTGGLSIGMANGITTITANRLEINVD